MSRHGANGCHCHSSIQSGRGALRLWVDFAGSQANDVVADLELADVRTTLGAHLAPLALAHLGGRAEWKRTASRTTVKASNLSLALLDGDTVGPSDFELTIDDAPGGSPGHGSLAFGQVALRPLATIAAHLSLPPAARNALVRLEPQGALRGRIEWVGDPAAPEGYAIRADLSRLTIASRDGLPGVADLSGSIDATDRGGLLRVAGERMTLTLPHLFDQPAVLDSIRGEVRWQQAQNGYDVLWKNVQFANGDAAGTTDGSWQPRADGPGHIDVAARLTRINLTTAYRYLPVVAAPSLREWLRRAIVKGTSDDARLDLSGDLERFPFAQGKGGSFQFAMKAHGVTLNYAERWPALTDMVADMRIDGPRVVIDASSARVRSAQIGATHVEIADLHAPNPVLQVDGTASGSTSEFLAFVATSPVAEWIGHDTDAITAAGDGQLMLKFALPLRDPPHATFSGDYRLMSDNVQLPGMPALTEVTGDLTFTERDLRASGITAQAMGGPIKLDLAHDGDHILVDAEGHADVALVRAAFDVPLLAHVSGDTDWHLAVDVHDRQAAWTVQSSLAGAVVDLPAPIGKSAAASVPLRVERRVQKADADRISIDYGDIAKVVLHRQTGGPAPVIDRAVVLVGRSMNDAVEPDQPGIWIRADAPVLDVDAWLDVDVMGSDPASASATTPLVVNGVDLQAGSVTALGRTFSRVKTSARRRNGEWRLALDAAELSGTATWRTATASQPNGRVAARLTRLTPPPVSDDGGANAATARAPSSHWPAVDLVADTVIKKGRDVGRLELQAEPVGTDWRIRKLALVNDAGRIDADGWWRIAPTGSHTILDVAIDVKEAGAFLGRFGWPDAVKGAPTKIDGQVSWAGAPSDFDYPSLAGNFTLRSGAGQFTKLEPGAARLLGVLSLQALPRRISLDFRDVFSEGFAFDAITGNVRMDKGIMHSDALRLVGPAAAVDIAGDVDLAHETQQLNVRVKPSLSTGVSAGAAALFIANPLLGAAIGAGTLLAQKMLNNPFDALFSYRYVVSGTFDDPTVTRAGTRAADAQPSPAEIR